MMNTVYLSLGSNSGDREENLSQALALLSQKVKLEKTSSIYETEPMGYKEQPLFLNLACQITTDLNPGELLELAKRIEKKLGRIPGFPDSPRPIDIDILLYDDKIIAMPDLIIPHPRIQERAFVLIPLSEIAPELIHSELNKSIGEMAAAVAGSEGVRKWQ
ncbi:MAG: 2-amino-4-hydroxy-6-hydroxymethyldihydropteridine diphosphokinase [Chloroflexota bacterium]|nr:2-amino-4-hydroxy-6-hydroxymethyldihydropteridine diphosphokinase [Chloroflexota bacterium]